MILIYIDQPNKIVNVFTDTGRYCIQFDQVFQLQQYFANQQVIIVNTASISTINSVIGSVFNKMNGIQTKVASSARYEQPQIMVQPQQKQSQTKPTKGSRPLRPQNQEYQPNQFANSSQPMFVRSTRRGTLNITDIGDRDQKGKMSGFTFNGYEDFVSLQSLNQIGFQKSANVKMLLNKGLLQLVPASKVEQVKQQFIQTRRPMRVNNQYAAYKSKVGQREDSGDDERGLIVGDDNDRGPRRRVQDFADINPLQVRGGGGGGARSISGAGGGGGGGGNEGGLHPAFQGRGSLISQVFGVAD